jgi:chromate reductase
VAEQKLDTLVICGSLRKGSFNAALARQLPGWAPPGLALRSAPPFEKFPIYNFDIQSSTGFPADVNAWADAVRSADAVIVVSPEYNFSIPGGLKNAIDWVSRLKEQPFGGKPVALQSCSGGLLGGSRMQYHMRMTLTALGAILLGPPEVFINFAAQKFDEQTLTLKDQTAINLIKQQLAAFETFARKLIVKG